jgi:hypothetical protein
MFYGCPKRELLISRSEENEVFGALPALRAKGFARSECRGQLRIPRVAVTKGNARVLALEAIDEHYACNSGKPSRHSISIQLQT